LLFALLLSHRGNASKGGGPGRTLAKTSGKGVGSGCDQEDLKYGGRQNQTLTRWLHGNWKNQRGGERKSNKKAKGGCVKLNSDHGSRSLKLPMLHGERLWVGSGRVYTSALAFETKFMLCQVEFALSRHDQRRRDTKANGATASASKGRNHALGKHRHGKPCSDHHLHFAGVKEEGQDEKKSLDSKRLPDGEPNGGRRISPRFIRKIRMQ